MDALALVHHTLWIRMSPFHGPGRSRVETTPAGVLGPALGVPLRHRLSTTGTETVPATHRSKLYKVRLHDRTGNNAVFRDAKMVRKGY